MNPPPSHIWESCTTCCTTSLIQVSDKFTMEWINAACQHFSLHLSSFYIINNNHVTCTSLLTLFHMNPSKLSILNLSLSILYLSKTSLQKFHGKCTYNIIPLIKRNNTSILKFIFIVLHSFKKDQSHDLGIKSFNFRSVLEIV